MSRKVGALLSYALMVVEVLSTLLLTPIIIRFVGDAEYGVYKLIASISSYLLLLDLGMGNSIIRYVAKYKENNDVENSRKYIGVCIIFYSIVSLIVLFLGGILIFFFKDVFAMGLSDAEIILSKKLLVVTVLNASITLGTSVFNNVIIAYSKFVISKGSAIIQIVVRIVLTTIVLKIGFNSVAIVTINLLLTLFIRSFYAIYVLYILKLKPQFNGISIKFVKEIVTYSSFVLLQMIATQINAYADQVLIGMFVVSSASIIGIYGVGTQIVQYFQSIGHALGGILMPGVVKMVENDATPKQLQNEMVRIGRYSFTILGIIYVGFWVNGKAFLYWWVGSGYEQSYYVTLILMFAYLFILSESIGTQILWAKNKHQMQSVVKFSIVIVNILLTILLIKWQPLLGATLGTFISLMLGDVLSMNIVFKLDIGISLREYYLGLFKGILPSMFLAGGVGYLISMIRLDVFVGLVINIIVMVCVYVISLWLWGFNQHEKMMVEGIIFKMLKNNDKAKRI